MKKKALQARMNRSEAPSATPATLSLDSAFTKRKNPFRYGKFIPFGTWH